LARVVGVRDRTRLFEKPVVCLVLDRKEREAAVLIKLIAKTGEIKPVHQVFDIERSNAQRHGASFARKHP
jgi:hypothetical protein